MSALATPWRAVLLLVLAAAPFVTHATLAEARALPFALALAAAQVGAVGVALRWIGARRAALPVMFGLAALLGWSAVAGSVVGPLAAAGGLHAAAYVGLLAWFLAGLTGPGPDPVTRVAYRLDRHFHPGMERYTRAVAWVWCGFFVLQLGVSAGLLLLAPVAVWSLWINVLDPPLLAAMMLGEYVFRRLRFPGHPHVGVTAVMRGWRADPAATSSPAVPRHPGA